MTGNIIELREGGAQDVSRVTAIMTDAFDPRFGEAWTYAQCMGMLSLPGVWMVIASRNGEDLGFAMARIAADEAELLLIATTRSSQRSGIGGALLRSVLAEAQALNAARIHLEVRSGNPALELYSREGFSKIGERRSYYRGKSGELFDAHTYSRELS